MDNPRPEKVAVVDEVRERLERSPAAVVAEYRGLDVAAMARLRVALRDAGGEFKIYKNTLVRFAARDLGLELDELLTGPTAIAFVGERPDGTPGDAVELAKALRTFSRENPALVVKGGLLGDKTLTADDTRALADVEPREVLLAKLAGAMAAPMVQFAGLLQALPRNLAYGLKALIEQGGGSYEPTADASPADAADVDAAADAADADADAAATPEAPAAESTDSPETDTDVAAESAAADPAEQES